MSSMAGGKPCSGRLEVTQEYLDAARGSSLEEKYEDIKADASRGCKRSCICQKVKSWFEIEIVEGREVRSVISRCISQGRDLTSEDPPLQ
jgi:hypothetical protein